MPPRKKQEEKKRVADAWAMLLQPFRLHCQTRHPNMGFRTRNEHEQDHRLHADTLDHIHTKKEQEEQPEGEENA
jgi:hypothetical protein